MSLGQLLRGYPLMPIVSRMDLCLENTVHTVDVFFARGLAVSAIGSSIDPIIWKEGSSRLVNRNKFEFMLPIWRSAGFVLCENCRFKD